MSQLAATNIGTVEVGNAIGLGMHDYGMLCNDMVIEVDHVDGGITWYKSGATRAYRINKWSKWKPIASNALSMTPTILDAANYGLDIPDLSCGALRTYALTDLDVDDDTTQIKWDYTPWVAGCPYRIDDFRNYQHASVPMFYIAGAVRPSDDSAIGVYYDGYGLRKWTMNIEPSQVTGGLVPSDFDAVGSWHLGVMLIDYESVGNEIVLIKANDASLQVSRTIEIDITSLLTSTYIVSFFIYVDELGGFAQINSPTEVQLQAIGSVYPIENGMPAAAVGSFSEFIMWSYGQIGSFEIAYDDSDYYTLNHNASYDPTFLSSPARMLWDDFGNFFSIEPIITFDPPYTLKWSLDFSLYLHETAWWADDSWRTIVTWYDVDGNPVALRMKTVLTGGIKIIHLEFWDLGLEEIIGTEYTSTETLSESLPYPTLLGLSNYNVDSATMTVSLNGVVTELANSAVNMLPDPPAFVFGYSESTDAPKGLAYNYINLIAYGRA
jgi:hypothetical protein